VITFFSLLNVAWFRPYLSPRDNSLATFQQVNQFMVLSVLMLVLTKNDEDMSDASLSYVLIFLYTATGISMLVAGTFEIMKEIDDDQVRKRLSYEYELQTQGTHKKRRHTCARTPSTAFFCCSHRAVHTYQEDHVHEFKLKNFFQDNYGSVVGRDSITEGSGEVGGGGVEDVQLELVENPISRGEESVAIQKSSNEQTL